MGRHHDDHRNDNVLRNILAKLELFEFKLDLLLSKQTGITDEERAALKAKTAEMKASAEALTAALPKP